MPVARSCRRSLSISAPRMHGKKIAVHYSVRASFCVGENVCMMSRNRRIAIVCQPWDNVAPQSRGSLAIISYELARRLGGQSHVIICGQRGPGQNKSEMDGASIEFKCFKVLQIPNTAAPPISWPMVFRRLSSMSARAFGSRTDSLRRSTCRFGNRHHPSHKRAATAAKPTAAKAMTIRQDIHHLRLLRSGTLGAYNTSVETYWSQSASGLVSPDHPSRDDQVATRWPLIRLPR
jgi:hypothetical protein